VTFSVGKPFKNQHYSFAKDFKNVSEMGQKVNARQKDSLASDNLSVSHIQTYTPLPVCFVLPPKRMLL
jgi:hypothetical protein